MDFVRQLLIRNIPQSDFLWMQMKSVNGGPERLQTEPLLIGFYHLRSSTVENVRNYRVGLVMMMMMGNDDDGSVADGSSVNSDDLCTVWWNCLSLALNPRQWMLLYNSLVIFNECLTAMHFR